MPKYVFTKRAKKDLQDIWNFTYDQWSNNQADKYLQNIFAQCDILSKDPELGKTYFQLSPNLRGFKINRHIIFYRVIDKTTIEITRVLN